MRASPIFVRFPLVPIVLAVTALAGCTRGCSDSPHLFRSALLPSGTKPFIFDTKAVQVFEITKADPSTGDRWSARLERVPASDTTLAHWAIRGGPDGVPLQDRFANSNHIDHLLDTLNTLQLTEPAPNGPPESFGLKPPRYALRWTTPQRTMELHVGAPTDRDRQAYGTFDLSPDQVYVIRGAALQMLSYLDTFDAIRQRTLLLEALDDFSEIAFRKPAALYAQRDGDVWADRKHKPLAKAVAERLEKIAHLRIEKFEDQDTGLAARINAAPDVEATLTLLTGRTVILRAKRVPEGEALHATVSDRPGAYRLYPGAAPILGLDPKR